MKKLLFSGLMAVCLLMLASNNPVFAQKDETTSVHITIKEDGKVTTDTTFEMKEGQDPEMIKEMVHHLSGDDVHIKKKNVMIMHKGEGDHSHEELAWVHSDGGDFWHVKSEYLGINLDSIKEVHGGEKVLVFKDEDGNVTVKELGEDEDHEMHHNHKGDGDHEIMIIESDEEGETIQIKKMKREGSNMMIISVDDDDIEWMEKDEDDENVEVYVIKNGDKDVKVVKKVTVEVEHDSDDDVEKDVEVEVKTKKEKKEK